MPIENFKANTIRLKHFDTHEQFNEWIVKQKGIIIIHITTMLGVIKTKEKAESPAPRWRVLVIYSELSKEDQG